MMARLFNGTSDNLQKTSPSLPGTNYTIAGYVYPVAVTASRAFFGMGDHGAADQFPRFDPAASGKIQAVSYQTSTGADTFLGTTVLTTSVWYHVAQTRTSTTLQIYVNGVLDGTTGTGGPNADYGASPTLDVGSRGASGFFNGRVAEFAVWSVVLTGPELLSLTNGALASTVQAGSLVSYNRILGASPETDSIDGNNLTVTGTTVVDHPPAFLAAAPTLRTVRSNLRLA